MQAFLGDLSFIPPQGGMKGGGEGRVRRDEKRASLKTPSWKASETAEIEPIQDQFSRICGEVKKRAAWALGTGSTVINPCSPTRIQKIQLKYLHVTCNYV